MVPRRKVRDISDDGNTITGAVSNQATAHRLCPNLSGLSGRGGYSRCSKGFPYLESFVIELRAQGTLVVGVHAGFLDTDMAARVEGPKTRPQDVAVATMEAIVAGREEVLADKTSQEVRAALAADPQSLNRQMQQFWESSKR